MHKIIVPVDFSDISAYGTTLAVKLATHLNAEVHFLHIVNLPSHILLTPEGELFEDGDFDVSVPKQQKAAATVSMANWAQRYFPQAITCVCYGHVTEDIIKYARKNNASLMVMGTHAVSGLKEALTNSHGEFIAMHSDVPVMTIKSDRSDLPVRKIVLAGSFKQDDIPHCDIVIALQRAFDATLHLVRVNTPNDFLTEEETYRHMEAFTQQYGLSGVEFAVYNDQDVEEGIIHYVAKNNIDLIAIGSKQRTGLNKLINGCVSADLVNHANKPILTFKLKD
jgi:nucleotide-binding universal stress UspA family protein